MEREKKSEREKGERGQSKRRNGKGGKERVEGKYIVKNKKKT